MKLKTKLNVSDRGKRMKSYHRRRARERLWESFLGDLSEAIELWKSGELSNDEMRQALYTLFLGCLALDDEDEIHNHLREVDLCILDDQTLIVNGIKDLVRERRFFDGAQAPDDNDGDVNIVSIDNGPAKRPAHSA